MTDLSHVEPRHTEVHEALEHWARWLTSRPGQGCAPMFRMYQSKARQWEAPVLRIETNPIEAMKVEKVVQQLPDKHRQVVRWYYVWPYVPVHVIRRDTGTTHAELCRIIAAGRDMIKNRL